MGNEALFCSCFCFCGPLGGAEPRWVGVMLPEGQVVLPSSVFFRIRSISETAAGWKGFQRYIKEAVRFGRLGRRAAFPWVNNDVGCSLELQACVFISSSLCACVEAETLALCRKNPASEASPDHQVTRACRLVPLHQILSPQSPLRGRSCLLSNPKCLQRRGFCL